MTLFEIINVNLLILIMVLDFIDNIIKQIVKNFGKYKYNMIIDTNNNITSTIIHII